MLVLALLLLILATLMFLIGTFGGSDPANLSMGPIDLDLSSTAIFFLGMATLAVFAVSLVLFQAAGKRGVKRRRERKQVKDLSRKLDRYERAEEERSYGTDAAPGSDGPRG